MTTLLLVTGYTTLQLTSARYNKQQKQQEVTQSLALAKEALIGFAVNYVDNYGHNMRGGVGRLPCPSVEKYGSPAMRCGPDAIGFLPGVWKRGSKRIDIDHLEKFLNQDLLYALSADYRYNPSYNTLNPDTTGNLLTVNGDDQVVAVLLAPGEALQGQLRDGEALSIADFLEAENADGDTDFASASGAGNDRLITITRAELLPLMERRVLGYVKDWLAEYKTIYGHYPYAARFGDDTGACEEGLLRGKIAMQRGSCSKETLGEFISQFVPKGRTINKIWFHNYRWSDFVYYHVDQNCTWASPAGLCDPADDPPLSLQVNDNPVQVLLVSVGEAIQTELVPAGQYRAAPADPEESIDMLNYFDTAELMSADLQYDLRRLDSLLMSGLSSNDQYLTIQ